MRANLFWFSDGQWARIEPFIPSNRRGVKPKNNRRILSGIMHVLKSGCRWVDLSAGIWAGQDGLQSLQPLECAGNLAEHLRGGGRNSFRKSLRKDGIKPVIPGRSNRKKRIHHDKQTYKDRNVIERCYCRLKDFRRIATRYDKLARNYFSALCLVAAVAFWL